MDRPHSVSVAGVIVDAQNRALLIQRRDNGKWEPPGGVLEREETIPEALQREVLEETGLVAEVVGPLESIDYWFVSYYDPEPARIHKRVHFFLLRHTGGSTNDHDDEVKDARWVEIGEALRLLSFDGERRVMAKAQEALAQVTRETGTADA